MGIKHVPGKKNDADLFMTNFPRPVFQKMYKCTVELESMVNEIKF